MQSGQQHSLLSLEGAGTLQSGVSLAFVGHLPGLA